MNSPSTSSGRRGGQLTLQRQSRKISLQEYHALSREERLELIRQGQGKEKYDLILQARDAEQLVPALHPQEIYLTVKEVGSEHAVELLMLTSTEQLTTLLDLDCWEGDSVSSKSALHWLQLLLETGEEKVCRTAQQMEPELLALFCKQFLHVTRGPEAYDDDDAANANRLEGLYDIEYQSEAAAKIVGGILDILLRRDEQTYLLLMEMIRGELDATLEEEVYHSRSNRLLDLGFAEPIEARSIYSYIDPERFTPGQGKSFALEAEGLQNPAALLCRAQPTDLLAEILSAGLNHELATELCLLGNRKMSADRVDIGDAGAVETSLQHLYHNLNLALEHLADTDAAQAEQIFQGTYLQQLFQLGSSLTQRLCHRARQLSKGPIGPYLDGPFRRFVDSLNGETPMLFSGIRLGDPQQERPFRNRRDLRQAEQQLQQLEIQRLLFTERFSFSLPDPQSAELQDCQPAQLVDLCLSDLFLTAVANQLLGREFTPTPIPSAELAELHGLVCSGGKLSETVRTETCRFVESLAEGASSFAEYCLEIWQEELCGLKPDQLDPRYVSGLIIRL